MFANLSDFGKLAGGQGCGVMALAVSSPNPGVSATDSIDPLGSQKLAQRMMVELALHR